jgi:hypothetical protein
VYFDGAPSLVYENVSDDYRVLIRPAVAQPEREVEPNDAPSLGNPIRPGTTVRAALGWARDVDLYCLEPGEKRASFVLDDAVERPRSAYSVLQVTMRGGPDDGIPVRVHRSGAKLPTSPRDVVGTYRSVDVEVDAASPPCIELTLVPNPWGPNPPAIVAPPGDELYSIRVEAR